MMRPSMRPCEYCGAIGVCEPHCAETRKSGRPTPLASEGARRNVPRVFASGASRDTDEGKLDFEGFLSPAVLQAFAEHMQKNRLLADGSMRASDNWQKGIPRDQYMKSMWRHFFAVWLKHRTAAPPESAREDLCALLFNVMGVLFEDLKGGT